MAIFVMVKDGLVEHCTSVNSRDDLVEIYTEHEIIEQTGNETVGWKYDGVNFTVPLE